MSQQTDTDSDNTVVQITPPAAPHEEVQAAPPLAVVAGRPAAAAIAPDSDRAHLLEEVIPGINPLVKVAAHLLLETAELRKSTKIEVEPLRARLVAEIRGFSSRALAAGISAAQVNAARYLLCTALDEAVIFSGDAGARDAWPSDSLLSTFHKDTWGGEVFFEVLARAMEQPANRLYLLEFIYLLLSLGFEGKYRMQGRGPLALESLRDQLYRQIRLLRGEPGPDLAKKLPPSPFKNKTYAYVPTWIIAPLLLFCLAVIFWGFFRILEGRAQPLLAQLGQHGPVGKLFLVHPEQPDPTLSAAAEPLSRHVSENPAGSSASSPHASEVRP